VGLATLASATDEELDRLLRAEVPDAAARRVALARLRVEAPFASGAASTPAALARRLISEALAAARIGDRDEADALVLDAYLRGIEEIEAPLRARDAALVTALEDGVMRLRAAIAARGPDAEAALERRGQELLALLGRAERETDETPVGALLLGAAAALLILREGLEAALIVAAILAVVRRVGLAPAARRAVHLGWSGALLAGLATFALARTALSALSYSRELVEALVSLLAAAVLFATSFWLISKADARRWTAYVKARAAEGAAAGGAAGLFSIAFLATYREAFESVLFFEALAGGVASRALPLAAGAAAGAVALALCVLAIGALERRLPIGPFFAVSGGLLSALSVVLLGHGVHALQASSWLLPRPVDFVRIDWLGVYPDLVSLGAQAALLAAIAAGAVALRRGAASPENPRPA
jgi:high-affinity iron transporter